MTQPSNDKVSYNAIKILPSFIMLASFFILVFVLHLSAIPQIGDAIRLYQIVSSECGSSNAVQLHRDFEVFLPMVGKTGIFCNVDFSFFQKTIITVNLALAIYCCFALSCRYGSDAGLMSLLLFILVLDFWTLGQFFRQIAASYIMFIALITKRLQLRILLSTLFAATLHLPTTTLFLSLYLFIHHKAILFFVGIIVSVISGIFHHEIIFYLKTNYGTINNVRGTAFTESASVNSLNTILIGLGIVALASLKRKKVVLLIPPVGFLALYSYYFLNNLPDELYVRLYLYYKFVGFVFLSGFASAIILRSVSKSKPTPVE